jgi:hypothetical protein
MQNIRISHALMWVAVALYLIVAIAWAGVDPTTQAARAEASTFAAIVYNPNTWAFIGWESIFILAGLTVRALVIRLTE